jgi:hypothetical protein
MDGQLGQYAAYIATCKANEEPVETLEEAMFELLTNFAKKNNGNLPKKIIVYRDGISEGQFESALDSELRALKDAIMSKGCDPDFIQIAIVGKLVITIILIFIYFSFFLFSFILIFNFNTFFF